MSHTSAADSRYFTQPAIGVSEGLLVIHSASNRLEGQIKEFVEGLANKGAFEIGPLRSSLLSEIADRMRPLEGPFYGQLYQPDEKSDIDLRLLDRGGIIVFEHTLSNSGVK